MQQPFNGLAMRREANGDVYGVHSLRQAFAGQMEAPKPALPHAQWHPDDELEEELAPKQPKPVKVSLDAKCQLRSRPWLLVLPEHISVGRWAYCS